MLPCSIDINSMPLSIKNEATERLARQVAGETGESLTVFSVSLALVRVNVGAQNGVHARKMAFALFLEPIEYVAVNAKMHGCFAARHDDAGAFPEIFADRRGFRRLGA